MRHILSTLGLLLCLLVPASGHAQSAPERFARIVVLKPKPGHAADFAAGYRRHIAWHAEHADPWTWYGWTFVLGGRMGQFMDGTFGHRLEDFDRPVDPRGDAADNAANVTPHADFVGHGVYERLEAASVGDTPPDDAPYLSLATYSVFPGRESAFEALIAEAARRQGDRRASWYRLLAGGALPQYLLMRPARTFSEGAAMPALEIPRGLVERIDSELLRFQPDMSHVPTEAP